MPGFCVFEQGSASGGQRLSCSGHSKPDGLFIQHILEREQKRRGEDALGYFWANSCTTCESG
jgi:hypothetical protein